MKFHSENLTGWQIGIIVLCIAAIHGELNGWIPAYEVIFPFVWMLILMGYAIFVTLPRFTVAHSDASLKSQISHAAFLLALILVFTLVSLWKYEISAPAAFILLASLLSAAVIALGWHIGAVFTYRSNRKQHTMNVLIDSRLSPEFQRHLRNMSMVYPGDTVIQLDKVEIELTRTDVSSLKEDSQAIHENRAIYGARYILNFYEFLSGAIYTGDCEEEVVYQTVGTFIIKLPYRLRYVIEFSRRSQPSAFIHILKISKRWRLRYEYEWGPKALGNLGELPAVD